jgi:hypothetical protein
MIAPFANGFSRRLNAQPWAHMLTKNIVVQDGVVHLWGLVQTKEERHALRVAAENTPGAKSVEDHLRQYRVIGGLMGSAHSTLPLAWQDSR